MEWRALPRVTRRGRLWRGLWPDHNPLRRTCDRVEAAIAAGLLAAFLIGAPLLALFAGQQAYSSSLRAERAQWAARSPVPAVLLTATPVPVVCWCAVVGSPAWARWTAPDGRRGTGWVLAPAGARPGSTVTVWVDSSGRLTGPPLDGAQVVNRAILAAVAAPAALGFVLLAAGMLAHRVLDRRRLAAWDAEWRVTGPRWASPR